MSLIITAVRFNNHAKLANSMYRCPPRHRILIYHICSRWQLYPFHQLCHPRYFLSLSIITFRQLWFSPGSLISNRGHYLQSLHIIPNIILHINIISSSFHTSVSASVLFFSLRRTLIMIYIEFTIGLLT